MYAGCRWLIVLNISTMSLCRFFLCIIINNNNNTIFSQGNSISYKYSCYQEKPCIELKKLKKIAIHKEEDTKSYKNVKN